MNIHGIFINLNKGLSCIIKFGRHPYAAPKDKMIGLGVKKGCV